VDDINERLETLIPLVLCPNMFFPMKTCEGCSQLLTDFLFIGLESLLMEV
jgi:hypothetical protein